jgi:phosphatidylinositol dimannoside acyltransferase
VIPEERREIVGYWLYAAAAWLGQHLPERVGRSLYTRLGYLAYRLAGRSRRVVAANMGRVLGRDPGDPAVQRVTREAFASYGRYWFYTFYAGRMSREEVLARFAMQGCEIFDEARAAGTGVVVALPHMGNWDLAARWMSVSGYSLVAVAERLQPEALFRLFREHREALGVRIVGQSDPDVGRQLGAALRAKEILALLADRDLSGRGIRVEMFGGERTLPAGPAALALRSGAPLVVAAVTETPDGGWRCVIGPPLTIEPTGERRADVEALTRVLAEAFERAISASPADWHIFQPGWIT